MTAVAGGPSGASRGEVRVFVVDDHRLFLSGVQAELGGEFVLVGSAGSAGRAHDSMASRTAARSR